MQKTLVWAHRGASSSAPENTLPAFRRAAELGADGVELDVQLTKDGQLVVIHDETLERVSNGAGWVKDYTLAELRQLDFNRQFPEYGPQPIPTLEEVYRLLEPTDLTVNVELKTGIVFYEGIEQKVLDTARACGMEQRVLYSSFNHYTLQTLKKIDPTVKTGVLYMDGLIDAPRYAAEVVGADAVHPALYNVQFPGYFADCRARGLRVHVWTVNEEAYMRLLCQQHADALITNDPALARRVVDECAVGEEAGQ